MYINPFWAGVASTVVFEVLCVFAWAIAIGINGKRK